MKKKSLWISACAALTAVATLAGCGGTTYTNGRSLPPSGITNRVMIAIQNPSSLSTGALEIVDAYYDERTTYNGSSSYISIAGYGSSTPVSIQNMPEEQLGAVYSSSNGSLALVNYAGETVSSTISNSNGVAASEFITRSEKYVFAANLKAQTLTAMNESAGTTASLSLPSVYRVSVNTGGSVALAFVENSNYVYYPRQLTTAETLGYTGGSSKWPKAAVDCEPRSTPTWCLFQMQSPDNKYVDNAGETQYYGAPLTFDHPIKAVFSSDGSTAYILSCGPECGGSTASYTAVQISPMIFLSNQSSGLLPTTTALANATVKIPGGASNALIDGTTMYVVGQAPQTVNNETLYGGNLTVVDLSKSKISNAAVSISDGTPGATSRMIEADDDTLWIAMQDCTTGVRYATSATGGYGCLTMYNTSTNTVTMLESYIGSATGIAAVSGLHKIYAAVGGQVYIYSTKDGSSLDNQYVTVTGTAYDVAYMDATTDSDNTVY